MKIIFVSLLLLILISSIITITVQESTATSKADKIREGAKDLEKTLEEGLNKLGRINNNNQNIQGEFDNSEDQKDRNDKPSIAEELRELAQLKKEGIITEKEFIEMKKDLIE
jgi:Skp family chaperone for outer membrane proteins